MTAPIRRYAPEARPRGAYYTYGNDLAKMRVRLGLTQSELATAAGVSDRTVREHEKTPWPNARASGRKVHAAITAVLADLARSRETGKIGQP